MAISNILPRKTMQNRTRLQSMTERHEYDQKAEKTMDGELVSSYMCSPETAAKVLAEKGLHALFDALDTIYADYRRDTQQLKSYMERQWNFVGRTANTFSEMII